MHQIDTKMAYLEELDKIYCFDCRLETEVGICKSREEMRCCWKG